MERVKAIAHFEAAKSSKSNAKSKSKFSFIQYKADPVKQQLAMDYRQKCAYCESFIGHVSPADIDHFRPKNAYRDASGVDVKPGYYWLASSWDNLFPSCQFCNRPTKQTLATGGRKLVGKGTYFPLLDESKRATEPGTEAAEESLLLNPDQADVESHLEFSVDGVVVPAVIGSNQSPMGRHSIDIYGLQRVGLVHARGAHLQGVKATIVRYKRERQTFMVSPDDIGVRERLEEVMKEIKEYLCCRRQYLTMTRQHIAKECKELLPLPECTDTSCIDSNF